MFRNRQPSNAQSLRNSTYQQQLSTKFKKLSVDNECFLIFFDTGCSDFVSRHKAIKRLRNRTRLEHHGPIQIGGVGGISMRSQHGIYSVFLPLFDESNASFTGVCLDKVTSTLPIHDLQEVERDVYQEYDRNFGDCSNLSKLPRFIGGDVDFIIGVKYLRDYPEKIFQLNSGLTIYRSAFTDSISGRGVIGGPHHVFNSIPSPNRTNTANSQFITYHITKIKIYLYLDSKTTLQIATLQVKATSQKLRNCSMILNLLARSSHIVVSNVDPAKLAKTTTHQSN